MEKHKDTGGSAFPIETTSTPWSPGMTLRDWFAGQAMTGLLADDRNCNTAEKLATVAYAIADAMLAEREKGAKE